MLGQFRCLPDCPTMFMVLKAGLVVTAGNTSSLVRQF
jgi:hypothetical protein